MSKVLLEEILSVTEIKPAIFKMSIMSEHVSQNATPGQFVNIKCSEGITPLLRRPISICNVDRSSNTFDIVFEVRGTGTKFLSKMKPGSKADIIAPLGKGFELPQTNSSIAVIGGGIGVFPLLFLLNEIGNSKKSAFIGYRNKESIVLLDEFEKACDRLYISTDDGSEGYHGFVTDLLEKELTNNTFDYIYTCGPEPMMKKVASLAEKHNAKCQVSLEQRMGCGIGACLVCACKTKSGDEWQYSHVCKDGPVFWSDEVIFD